MSFWKDGFSIDETNKSMLVFGLFISLIIMWITYTLKGYVGEVFSDVVKTMIYCVAGVNGIKAMDNIVGKIKG